MFKEILVIPCYFDYNDLWLHMNVTSGSQRYFFIIYTKIDNLRPRVFIKGALNYIAKCHARSRDLLSARFPASELPIFKHPSSLIFFLKFKEKNAH